MIATIQVLPLSSFSLLYHGETEAHRIETGHELLHVLKLESRSLRFLQNNRSGSIPDRVFFSVLPCLRARHVTLPMTLRGRWVECGSVTITLEANIYPITGFGHQIQEWVMGCIAARYWSRLQCSRLPPLWLVGV